MAQSKRKPRSAPRGRPAEAGEARSVQVQIRLLPAEAERWAKRAEADRRPLASWIRDVIERAIERGEA